MILQTNLDGECNMNANGQLLAAVAVLAGAGLALAAEPAPTTQAQSPALTKITEHLWVYPGPINVGVVRQGDKALLVDCGDGSAADRLPEVGVKTIEQVLFTHHHRDQCCGAAGLIAAGARIGVPEAERGFFAGALGTFDRRYVNLWYQNGPSFASAENIKVDAGYKDGQTFQWGPAEIRALATPGHTAGSMSYQVSVDGKKVIFCGDCIYDEGRIWDLYSLNREYGPFGASVTGKNGATIKYPIVGWSDYEAFLGAKRILQDSLARIKDARPDLLVPSHGRTMTDPAKAIATLVSRLGLCMDNYLAVSHLRWDFAEYFNACTDNARKDFLPLWKDGKSIRVKANPPCVSHRGATSWVLKSKDGPALVSDYETGVEKELQAMVQKGEITAVECLWISHYHDDHSRAGVLPFRKAFPAASVIADSRVAEIITAPAAAPPLPCLNPEKVQVDRLTTDGQAWQWHEFKLTAYQFPGQTLYHGALLAEAGDLRILFVGDSLTAGGIEDYCAYNRNFLGKGVGYDRCLELVEKLQPTHMLYAHKAEAFVYTADDCRFIRDNLAQREKLFAAVMPWDNPNYGTDPWWVMCRPYELHAKAGGLAAWDVVVTNHSSAPRRAACRAVPPRGWGAEALAPASTADASDWPTAEIPAKSEGRVRLTLAVPAKVAPGRYVVPVDVRYGTMVLPQFTVVLIVIDP
jgi:glyoxylase-like metal-dependent hydrolase (beta-lactamase superfamily II)